MHPDHRGRGLGEVMLDLIEARAAELAASARPGACRQRLVVWSEDSDAARRASLDRRGFVAVRQYFEMEIALDDGPARARSGPKGSPLAASGRAETTGAVRGRRGGVQPSTTCTSRASTTSGGSSSLDAPTADLTLWWLAWDGDDLAGFVIPFETTAAP